MNRRDFIKTALMAMGALVTRKVKPAPAATLGQSPLEKAIAHRSEDTLFGLPIVWTNGPGLKKNDVILGDFDQIFTASTAEQHWLDAVTYVSGENPAKIHQLNKHEKCAPLGVVGKAVKLIDDDDLSIHVRFTEQSEAWRFAL